MRAIKPKSASKHVPDQLGVWLDDPAFGPLSRLGTLSRSGVESVRFAYDTAWLANPTAFQLDPKLALAAGEFFPHDSNFGVFLDSCPDRWGQVLMKRRELVDAKTHGRTKRELHPWDFLLGVQDATRMGALRFSIDEAHDRRTFVANDVRAAPSLTQLAALQQVALQLSRKKIDDLSLLEKWLAVLVAPGASLGGARPKANLTGEKGTLWVAKFPAEGDERDVSLWEKLAHDLAKQCGLDVPESRVEQLGAGYHTFMVQRFDRRDGHRRYFTSAMTLLGRSEHDEASYLDLAQFIATEGNPRFIAADLRELFTRVVFNVAMANRDDHLRNHGFLRGPEGWRLSPAFDMNPSPKKATHVLTLDGADASPDLKTVEDTAEYYRLKRPAAQQIITRVKGVTKDWKTHAKRLGITVEERLELEALLG